MRGKPLTKLVESPVRDLKGGGFSRTALGRRPQNRAKGADPRTGNLKDERCFCPGFLPSPCLPVPGFSWLQIAGSPALSRRVPVWLFVLFLFLSFGRGRHVPAPGGRDVGSSARAQTQEPAFSRYPSLRSIFAPFVCDVRGGVARACFRVHGDMYDLRSGTTLAMSVRLVLIRFVFLQYE